MEITAILALERKWRRKRARSGRVGEEEEEDDDDNEEGDWKYCGPLGKPRESPCSFHPCADDVRLALAPTYY